jgi:hypothetical protein
MKRRRRSHRTRNRQRGRSSRKAAETLKEGPPRFVPGGPNMWMIDRGLASETHEA